MKRINTIQVVRLCRSRVVCDIDADDDDNHDDDDVVTTHLS